MKLVYTESGMKKRCKSFFVSGSGMCVERARVCSCQQMQGKSSPIPAVTRSMPVSMRVHRGLFVPFWPNRDRGGGGLARRAPLAGND